MKRILSLLLVAVMVFVMIPPLGIYAAEAVTVYLDPVNGSDENVGTETAPVKTLAGAYDLLQDAGGTVVLLGDVSITASTVLPACDHPVTITSKTGAEGIQSNSHITVSGDTTFQNMTLTLTKNASTITIRGGGHKLTMGEGLTCVPSEGYYFCLEGGFSSGSDVESTELTVKSGQYRYIYAGSYGTTVKGNTKLTMTGGTASWVAANRTGKIQGDVEMSFSGTAKVNNYIYCGAATTGNIEGSCTVTLGKGASFRYLHAASNGTGDIAGAVTVICDGYDGTFTKLLGKGGSSWEGSTGGSRLVLKSGTLTGTPTDFDAVDIDIPEGKTLTLESDLTADTLKSAGTLHFSGASTLTAKAVTGAVSCTVEQTLANHTYINAPAGAAITFPTENGITEVDGQWTMQDLTNFAGLVLVSDSANTVKLYEKIWNRGSSSDYTLVEPTYTETAEGLTHYYYANVLGGYHAKVSRSGYITVYKDIYMSQEEAATRTVQTITLDEKLEEGFVPSAVYLHTDEVLAEACKSDISMFPKYAQALKNPAFQEGRHPHKQTTNEELEASIASVDGKDDMYVFSLGKSDRYGYNIPMVIFTKTDLTGVTTLAEAAARMGNSRMNVFYRAQIHGNEPAGGEGALAMIHYLQQGYAQELLDQINLVIIPRLSPDSAQLYQRPLYNSSHTCDHLLLQTGEVQALQVAYLLFKPEVLLDGHERNWNNQGGDIQVSTSFTPMNSEAWQQTALAMDNAAFAELENNDLCGSYYSGAVNGYDPNMANCYFTTAGTLYVLMESRGIYSGNEAIVRRTVSHMAAVNGILDYLHENAEQVKSLVAAERQTFAANGAIYDQDDVLLLQTGSRTTNDADKEAWGTLKTDRQTVNWETGVITFPTRYPNVYDVATRSRVLPTAYVIPADAQGIDQVLLMAQRHGIAYTLLPEGATMELQHYGGTVTEATLGVETATRFAQGCYVFAMNQEKALVLATLMEPDVTNASSYGGTLAQRGYLQVTDTYRYIRNLNAQGTVDYTVTDANFVNITVWLDGTNGLDTNDGLTEATAVKTLEQAYAIMEAAMQGAAKGSEAYLKVVGLYELGSAAVELPAVNFHVTISGKTGEDGFSYTGGGSQGTRQINVNGDTTFQNMTLHINNTGGFNHLNANGHKVVLGLGLNCTTKGTHHFTLIGGGYSTDTASTDLTVLSGAWRSIYVGGYTGNVAGLAKADISGARVYNNIAAAYRANVGSVELTIRDTDLSVDTGVAAYSNVYAGTVEYKSGKGTVAGNSTVILGRNVLGNGAYASSCLNGYINGTATILADGVDLSQFPVMATSPRRATGTTAAAVLQLNADVIQNVTLDAALPVDLNGHNITGNLMVDGTLTVKDSQTDDHSVSDGVYGRITGAVTGTLAAEDGYVMVDNQSFHKLDQRITAVSIRPSIAGIYYNATWLCDEVLAAEVKTFGLAVSTKDAPEANFATDGDTIYTVFEKSDFASGKEKTSAMIANILKSGAADNDARGKKAIYAVSYITFEDGTTLVGEAVEQSLYSVMLLADETAYDANASALNAFYTTWEDVMKDWGFTNIGK